MANETNKKLAQEMVGLIKKAGFRAFLAEQGDYGFFTDQQGSRVVCFEIGLGGIGLSGNYKTSEPKKTGSGWRITDSGGRVDSVTDAFAACPPQWAINNAKWRFTTLDEHLATYQKSSRYTEV